MLQQTYFGLGEIQYTIKTNFTYVFSRWPTWLLENAASHRFPLHLYATLWWRLANFSSKYFELCGPYGFCCICSTQPLRRESCHRQRVNKRTWPCSNKTSFFFFFNKNRRWDGFGPRIPVQNHWFPDFRKGLLSEMYF